MDAKRELPGLEERSLADEAGRPLRYYVGGSGPPVVLVHGLGGLASNWRLVAPLLAASRRVLVPELPGHGGSVPLPRGATLDAFADAVLAVCELEGAAPAPWVGHSLGGAVALRAAVRRPDAVSGIVLAAGAGISSSTRRAEATLTLLGIVRPGRLLGRHRARVSRSRLGRTVAFGWWGVSDPAGLEPDMAEAFLAGPSQHADTATAARALVADDPRADLDRVRCPCLCLWGADDNWVPLGDGIEYARRLRAPLRVVAGCGHLLLWERPEVVARAVLGFLDSCD